MLLQDDTARPSDRDFLIGGGEMGALMRAHDWSNSPLGSPEGWPQSLRAVVALMINSRYPMFVAWGQELAFLYNDGYIPIFGRKHPHTLGLPFQQVWSEIWEDIKPLVDRALAGEPTFNENLHLVMERNGFPEDTWYSFSYSPVRDESGAISGMFCACTETTAQVLAARREVEERERQRRMFEQAPGFIAVMSGPDHVFEFANASYRRIFGDRDYIGQAARSAFPVLEGQAFFGWLDRVYATGERYVANDIPITLTDGPGGGAKLHYVNFIYEPVTDEAGRVTGIFCEGYDVTLAHEAEAARAESETRFRNMADHAPVMMWVTDPDGFCTYLNRSWYEFTGQTEPEAQGFGWLDATHPDDKAEAERVFLEANAAQAPFRVEYRLRRRDGAYRWAIDAASPRFGPDGEYLGYVGSVIDIDERRESEQRLALSEERLRLATDAADIGFWDVDVVNDQLFWPPRVKGMFGISPAVPVSLADFFAGLHPDDRDRTGAAFEAASDPQQRALYDVEYRTVGKEDGVVRWVAARGRGIFDESGRCVRVVGTAIDITDKKAIEAALRESEARVWALTDNLPSGMVYQIATGADGSERRFLYVSQSHEKLTGVPAEAVLADPTIRYQLILPEDRPLLAAAEAEAIRNCTSFDVEARFRHASGDVRWSRILSAARNQPDGSLIWDGIQVDITDQKQLETALEQRVAERTAELENAHEQLRQSQKMEAMGSLTGGVAHDFNNLLTPIIGSLDMLFRRGVGNDRERRLIDGALQSAERAKTLVQRLLAFARRQPLQTSAVDIAQLVENMVGLIDSTLGPSIDVRTELAADLPAARVDPNQLEMALLNLAVNARDAMPEGGRLAIAAAPEAITGGHRSRLPAGDYVRLSVADSGIGMDADTLRRAVEPFFSTKGIGKGTGLGLSMVHGLAAQLGGALTIQSTPSRGTIVELWLPVSEAAQDGSTRAAEPQPAAQAIGTALLVDDEELVRMSTADMLLDLGYHVVEAGSAEEALRLIADGLAPTILVTDHLMPGMNGTDLARHLRERTPELPVLLVSGYVESGGVAPDLARLTKPFRKAELAASLGAVLPTEA
jgi:PAS domain S-box-containing protein